MIRNWIFPRDATHFLSSTRQRTTDNWSRWNQRPKGLKGGEREEAWTKHDPSDTIRYSPVSLIFPIYPSGTQRSATFTQLSTDSECTMFTEALYVPHRDLGRRTQTSPATSLPATCICQHEAVKTHTSLRCSMLGRLTGCISRHEKK